MNFNSQIATTREQSEQLLALGINPETADCHIEMAPSGMDYTYITQNYHNLVSNTIASWSLSRLLELMPKFIYGYPERPYCFALLSDENYWFIDYSDNGGTLHVEFDENVFDAIVRMIGWLIKNNHFNTEYLKGKIK